MIEAAQMASSMKYGHIPRVLGAGISEYNRGRDALRNQGPHDVGDFDLVEAINRSIDRATLRVTADLRRGLSGLATVASSAPFVGLLGTVLGIITAFQLMASSGSGGLASVSAGLPEGPVATPLRLPPALPAPVMFHYPPHPGGGVNGGLPAAPHQLGEFFLQESRLYEALSKTPAP